MTFRFIDEHRRRWSVRLLCQTLDVSPAARIARELRDFAATYARVERLTAILWNATRGPAASCRRHGRP